MVAFWRGEKEAGADERRPGEDLAEEGTRQPSLLTGSAKVHVGGSDGGHGRGEEPERSRPWQPWRGLAGRRR